MRTKCLSAFVLTAAMAAASSASATALLVKHVPSVVAQHRAALAGALDPAAHMTLQVVLPMRNKAELGELAHAVSDPTSPLYRHYLSVAQFTRRFGPTEHDYDAAMKFFSDNGLNVTHTAANRYLFQVEGAAADVERVLHVRLNTYRHPSENRTFFAPDREPTLDLAVPVQEIVGPRQLRASASEARASGRGQTQRAGTGSGPGGNFIGSDFRAVYYATGSEGEAQRAWTVGRPDGACTLQPGGRRALLHQLRTDQQRRRQRHRRRWRERNLFGLRRRRAGTRHRLSRSPWRRAWIRCRSM